jgi:hypothetical protein
MAGAAEAAPSVGVLAPILSHWEGTLAEIEAHISDAIAASFTSGCRSYIAQRGELRLTGPTSELGPSLSSALCEPLSVLRAELLGLLTALPPASLRRVWPPIARTVDDFMYRQLVRRCHFSASGAAQLAFDAEAILALFAPFSSRPGAALRLLHESALLLSLPRAPRLELKAALMGGSAAEGAGGAGGGAASAGGGGEREAPLRRRLVEMGVHRLGVGEAAELLATVYDESE